MLNIYERCDRECRSEHCDDYGVEYCDATHNHAEDHAIDGFCARQAFLAGECEICQEWQVIHKEIQEGEAPERICHECYAVFKLDTENPYGEVLYCEGVGVYFQCNSCLILDSVMEFPEEEGDIW